MKKLSLFAIFALIGFSVTAQESYPVRQVAGSAKIFMPNTNVATNQQCYTVSTNVATITSLVGTLNEYTTDLRINVARGGDLCVTIDGKTIPVGGSVGEVWYGGTIFIVRKEQAAKMKFIREGSTDSIVSITQLTTQGVIY